MGDGIRDDGAVSAAVGNKGGLGRDVAIDDFDLYGKFREWYQPRTVHLLVQCSE